MDTLEEGLQTLGFESFRPGQREAVETLLADGRLLLVAPTGGGKSLTYQLPALLLPGTTLVVSPLIALMDDQVRQLQARGVAATFLASTLSGDEMRQRLAEIQDGAYKLVYVAPERLTFPGFSALLQTIDCPLIAIDEAHCISEWGHDFRPEYMQIGATLARMPNARVLACTATATPVVRDEILGRLGLPPETPQHLRGFARPNLRLAARHVQGPKERCAAVDETLAKALGDDPRAPSGAAIIYCPTRRSTEAEAERLAKRGLRVAAYHAGLSASERERVGRAFAHRKIDVVAATNAFGMGIDRADVRAVVHLAPPGSPEAYYQEVGRAGRDGEPARGLLLCSTPDMARRRRLLESPMDDRRPDPRVVEHKWNLFLELMRWVDADACRHAGLLAYFGAAEDSETCGHCDVCLQDDARPMLDENAATLAVRKALSGVARVQGRLGMRAVANLLRGAADKRLESMGLTAVSTFGALRDQPVHWIDTVLRRCVSAGWVSFSRDEKPLVHLTEDGILVMKAERPMTMAVPAPVAGGRSPLAKPSSGSRRGSAPAPNHEAIDPELFAALRAHRLDIARRDGVPPYVVASDRTLRDLAVLKPTTLSEVQLAHGIGPAKAERYGQGWIDIVATTA